MKSGRRLPTSLAGSAALIGIALSGYGAWIATTYARYGDPSPAQGDEIDPLLNAVMPEYEVAERHHILVEAPAAVTYACALTADFQAAPVIQGLIRARELLLGATPEHREKPQGLLVEVEALGWRLVAEEPGREIVMAAVTQPWRAEVVFQGMSSADFRAFAQPNFVKIAWTLRVDPQGDSRSILRTETRVQTTDSQARAAFRWYWARFSPGILIIRQVLLPQIRRDAEAWMGLH